MSRPPWRWCALLIPLVLAPALRAGEPTPDLALVPPDAAGFVHVRVADVWASDLLSEYRETVQKAGKQVLAAFDRRFLHLPSSIDRVTAFVTVDGGPPAPAVILSTTKPIDRPALLKGLMPGAVAEDVGGTQVWTDAGAKVEVHFPTDRLLVVGPPGTARALKARPRPADGPLTPALTLARDRVAVVALNPQALPGQAFRDVPAEFQPLLKVRLATLSVDAGTAQLRKVQSPTVAVRLDYPDADAARAAAEAARKGLGMARAGLAKGQRELEQKALADGTGTLDELPGAAGAVFALGMMNRLEEYLTAVPLERDGATLHVSTNLPAARTGAMTTAAVGVALLVPAVQKVREAAARMQSQNNLKQIGLAFHNYHDVYKKFPAAATCDPNGRPLVSWRVAILPFIEQDALYRQFNLDEPWDSPHNLKLLPQMPKTYALPGATPGKPGETYYRVFVGGGAGFEMCKNLRIPDYRDGTSNTIMVIEAAAGVPWTKPDELSYDPQRPLPRLGTHFGGGRNAAFFDATVRFIAEPADERTVRAYITRTGGEPVND